MNLYSDYRAAYNSGVNEFLRSKQLTKVYIFVTKCARKEFFVCFTEREIAQLKIKTAGAYCVIGAREGEKASWQEVQERLNNPEIKKYDQMVRYINAEKKARRLGEKIRKEDNANGEEKIC